MNKDLILNLPLNPVSFGNVSFAILREFFARGLEPLIMPIGPVDLSAQKPDTIFSQRLQASLNESGKRLSRKSTSIKLWHPNVQSLETYSSTDSRLITFHETDALTSNELNVLRNQDKVYVTSTYTKQIFESFGLKNVEYLPIGYDAHNFHQLQKRPKIDGVTSFGLMGKAEVRKSTYRILNLWAKKYGNQSNYRLNAAIHNPFIKPEQANALIAQALEGKTYYNINFLPWMATNAEYNQFLQANDISFHIGLTEGRDLPCYHSTTLGSWPIALDAHCYKDYLNKDNAILIEPSGKIPAIDGIFFRNDGLQNTGNWFTYTDESFYAACSLAEEKSKQGINLKGLELQRDTYKETVDILLKDL